MASAKLPVSVEQSAGGDISIGTKVDGVFVPIATVTGPQVSYVVGKGKAEAEPEPDEAEGSE